MFEVAKLIEYAWTLRRRLNLTAVHFFGNCLLTGANIANENIPPLVEEDIVKV